jgi:ribulose-5-phosphate 4-epimerase/fuculose-1-phosphate aldolase
VEAEGEGMVDNLDADAQALIAAQPPTFATVEKERRHRLERLAGVCRVFGRLGFSEGLLGHVTMRDPEHADRFWINPVGVSFRQMRVSHLVQVSHAGEVLIGNRPINPVGFRLHAAVHAARPEVNAVCHVHSLYGKAWSSLGRVLDPITQDSAVFFEQQALITTPRVALNEEQGKEFAVGFGDKRVAIQVGHGLFSTGRTVDEAAWWFIAMETSCQAQLLAEAAGTPVHWKPKQARMMVGALGTPEFGWASFQPFWDEVIVSDPDLVS